MRRLWLVVPALAVVLGAAAACGENGDGEGIASAGGTDDGGGAGAAAPLSDEEQAQAFTQCMRDNGIDMPDPDPNGGGGLAQLRGSDIDREQLMAALEACRDLMPGDLAQRRQDPAMQEQLREFAQCMRDNGIDVPDPDPNGGFVIGGGEIDPDDPEFQAALEACQEFLGGRLGVRR